ncbi:MAG: HAD family hydrolase [Thiotrichales bacterium]
MFSDKKALLLDMNSTFMFDEDRFGPEQDYSIHYRSIGGTLACDDLNHLIHLALDYLGKRYPDAAFRHCFPSLKEAFSAVAKTEIPPSEVEKIIDTVAFHEHGHIPDPYKEVLFKLREHFKLSLIIDIWAPKDQWIETFKEKGLWELFSAASFSSGHGMVKPSPKPFERVVSQLRLRKADCLVVGDSIRQDLGGALNAGIDAVLVGENTDKRAIACYPSLLDFHTAVQTVTLKSRPDSD